MDEILQFLSRHEYSILFAWVFVEQMGVPLPAIPVLLAVGALGGEGRINLSIALGLIVVAASLSNIIWYQVGRHRGASVLSLLCRVSLTPDSCVRRTTEIFSKHGTRSLLAAKFIPGLGVVAPPLAGVFRMSLLGFLLYNSLGTFLWVGTYSGLGYLFHNQIELFAIYALRLSTSLVLILIGGLVAYLVWKYAERRRFLQELQMARISPEELKQKLDDGEELLIMDVRPSLEFAAESQTIPGALHMALEELGKNPPEIPLDREVILLCN